MITVSIYCDCKLLHSIDLDMTREQFLCSDFESNGWLILANENQYISVDMKTITGMSITNIA